MALALSCRGEPSKLLTQLEDSRTLAAELRVQLRQAAEASNRAVMADTDDASVAAAHEAEQATKSVDSSAAALARLLKDASYASEAQLLGEFDARFSEYKELDRRILGLAVENTNLKAQALSFGPASRAASGFRDSLKAFVASVPVKDRGRADGLVADAVLAVREIQVLHAPHIAERDEVAMNRMEKEMADLDSKARADLASLEESPPPGTNTGLTDALAKLDQFKALTAQIVALSRRNTNLLSLDLSLGKKPALTAACDERIRALQDALAKEGPKATR